MSENRTYQDVEKEIIKLEAEYVRLRTGGDDSLIEDLEELRIPDELRGHFNRRYYQSSMEKLVWEEDD